MALTRDFKETVQARARSDPGFREVLLKEAVEAMLSGDVDVGKAVLRDYIHEARGGGRRERVIASGHGLCSSQPCSGRRGASRTKG